MGLALIEHGSVSMSLAKLSIEVEALKTDFGDYVGFVEVLWRFRVFIRLQALSKACLFKVLPSSGALNFVIE